MGGTTARVDRVAQAVAPLAKLPPGARLLHVALPGTGGSAVQRALHAHRASMADHGVAYAGRAEQLVEPVLAAIGRPDPLTGRPPAITTWRTVVHAAGQAKENRVVLSSEVLADAPAEAVRRIVDDLGSDRVHVLVSLVGLARILPDAWARAVEVGSERSFEAWLLDVLDGADEAAWEEFWERHRQDRLVARWVEVVGPGNVTVVVADDRLTVAAAIGRLTHLGPGSVAGVAPHPVDRALTVPELEVVRAFNARFRAERLDPTLHASVMRFGAVPYLKTRSPGRDEASIRLPAWALGRARAVAADTTDAIRASGVRIVGDLEALRRSDDPSNDSAGGSTIEPELAARAAMGVLLSTGLVPGAAGRIPRPIDAPESLVRETDPYVPRPRVEALALARMTTPEIAGLVGRRSFQAFARAPSWRRTRAASGPHEPRANPLLLPPGSRLLHIGPFKTGTTAVQGAFHARRPEVSAQGVHYAGPTPQPVYPVMAVTGRSQPIYGTRPPGMTAWRALLFEIRRAREPRVVISSEFFSDAGTEAIERIVHDLGPDRIHVVVTVRSLARIVASQWQQFVQSGARTAYRAWLRKTFDAPTEGQGVTFWRRHRHDQLVARWADVAGSSNVTVVAVDERMPGAVLRVFEDLTGLERETLRTSPDGANRSLTRAEVEVVRAFNALGAAEGVASPVMAKVMRYGAATYMKDRVPDRFERRIETPAWALERTRAVQREIIDAIAASGVRVVGDLERLMEVDAGPSSGDTSDDADEAEVMVPPEVAARASIGVLLASGLARGATRSPATGDQDGVSPSDGVHDLVTIQIAGVLARRLEAAARRPVDRLRRAVRSTRP